MESKPYLEYVDKFKKVNLLNLILSACSILMVFILLFVPILQSSETIPILDLPLELWPSLSPESIESGEYVVKTNFSIITELIKNIKGIEIPEYGMLLGLYQMLFPLGTVIYGIISIFQAGTNIYKQVAYYKEPENYAMLEYAKIESGNLDENNKKGFFKKQVTISFILFFLFTILFNSMFTKIFEEITSSEVMNQITYFTNFSGVSAIIVVDIIILAFFFFIKFYTNKKHNEISVEIIKKKYSKV